MPQAINSAYQCSQQNSNIHKSQAAKHFRCHTRLIHTTSLIHTATLRTYYTRCDVSDFKLIRPAPPPSLTHAYTHSSPTFTNTLHT